MAFDPMASYEQFAEHSIMRTRRQSSNSDKIKRRDSCISNSDPRQQQGEQQKSASSRTMTRLYKPSSLTPAIPAFQTALSKWSPPPSPGSTSPGTAQTSAIARPVASPARTPTQMAYALYTSACAGDFYGMQSAIRQGASVNSSVLVPGIFEVFKPAKSGHLSPLAGAASHGQLASVKFLVANNAEISPCTTRSASSPLHQACRSNSRPIVKFLLEQGADVDIENAYKVTPVMYACKYSSKEIVSLLLQHFPDLTKVSFIGSTALDWAVFSGRADVAELLLSRGADPNQAMPDGNTSLHCAVLTGSASMVKVMLRFGADPFVQNDGGETALMLAQAQVRPYHGQSGANDVGSKEKIVAMLKTVIEMWRRQHQRPK